jgi:hypothetical protein
MPAFSEGLFLQDFFDDTLGIHKKTGLRIFVLRITNG